MKMQKIKQKIYQVIKFIYSMGILIEMCRTHTCQQCKNITLGKTYKQFASP
jgi:hypothetical protein